MTYDDLKTQIKNIPPAELELHGVIEPAKTSANGEKTYICRACNNGAKGKTGDGLAVKHYSFGYNFKCFSCGQSFDNLALLAFYYGIENHGAGHFEILKRAAAEFGFSADFQNFNSYHNLKPMQIKVKIPSPPVKSAQVIEVEKLTAKYIKQALALQDNLENLPLDENGTWRGLTVETLRYFHCVYVQRWIHPKLFAEFKLGLRDTLPPRSRRLLIPTQDGLHYNAVILEADKAATPKGLRKMHAGNISLFGIETIEPATEIIYVYEGEINAMTEWQQYQAMAFVQKTIDIFGGAADVFKISDDSGEGAKLSRGALARKSFIATCSASNKSWIEQVDAICRALNIRPIFNIRFDKDDAGNTGAEYGKAELMKRSYLVKISLYDGSDKVNDI